jgi:GTPase SAR1 family protein
LREWLEEVRSNGNPYMEILLVGNKNDLEDERVVSYEEGAAFAKENNIGFIEINSKDFNKVSEAFNCVATSIYKRIQ